MSISQKEMTLKLKKKNTATKNSKWIWPQKIKMEILETIQMDQLEENKENKTSKPILIGS